MTDGFQANAESFEMEKRSPPDDNSLENRLNKLGLDKTFWTDKLKTCLGIDNVSQVEHLGPKELERLCKHTRHTWEETALYTFAKVDINYGKTELERCRKRSQEATKEYENIQLHPQNWFKDVEETEAKSSSLLDPQKWIYDGNSKSVKERMDNMVSEKINSETDLNMSPSIPQDLSALLQTASGGVALCGRSYDEKKKSYSNVHRQLIQAPTDLFLRQPSLSSEERTFESESKLQADYLNESLQKIGGGLSLIQTDIGVEKAGYKQSTQHSRQKFFTRIHCQWVPTGSIVFSPDTLKLSKEALKALKNIEKIIRIKGDGKRLQAACQDFIATYGTHMYVGLIHLGGQYTLEATYDSTTTQTIEEIKSLVAIKCNYACLYGVPVSLSMKATDATASGQHKNDESSTIQLRSDIRGGPNHVSSVEKWKSGLVSDSSTWAVISCQSSNRNDYIDVCDLVKNCPGMFEDANRLTKSLKKAIEPELSLDSDIYYINGAKSEIQKLKTNTDKIYCQDLMSLVERMWQCDIDFGTKKNWIKLFQEDNTIAEFLVIGPKQVLDESEKKLCNT